MENILISFDLLIINFLYEHPFLSFSQINLFILDKDSHLKERLGILCEYKYISFLKTNNLSNIKYYYLLSKALKVIKKKNLLRNSERNSLFLMHNIESNKFFINLKKVSLNHNLEFSDWISDRMIFTKFNYNGHLYTLTPDGFCIFNKSNIYLELDRGTEGYMKIFKKIDLYSDFYLSFEYKKYFEEYPKVIFIFLDSKRASLVSNRVSKYLDINKYKEELDFFYFYSKEDFFKNKINML